MKITRRQLQKILGNAILEEQTKMPDDAAHNVSVAARAERMIQRLGESSDMGTITGALIFILQNMKFRD